MASCSTFITIMSPAISTPRYFCIGQLIAPSCRFCFRCQYFLYWQRFLKCQFCPLCSLSVICFLVIASGIHVAFYSTVMANCIVAFALKNVFGGKISFPASPAFHCVSIDCVDWFYRDLFLSDLTVSSLAFRPTFMCCSKLQSFCRCILWFGTQLLLDSLFDHVQNEDFVN